MREVEILAVRYELPAGTHSLADAVRDDRIDEAAARQIGVESLPVSDGDSAPELAVRAARDALEASGAAASSIDLLLHAWTHHQGHDFWSPAHFIARQLGASTAIPIGIQQMCNGGAAALELAVDLLRSGIHDTALITTGDIYPEDSFDRWGGDFGLVYGDAGTAILLRAATSTSAGTLPRVLAVESRALIAAEQLHRGDDAFSSAPRQTSTRIDVRRTKRAYTRSHDMDAFLQANRDTVSEILTRLLERAGLTAEDRRLRAVVMPRVGEKIVATTYAPGVRAVTNAPLRHFARLTGHLGAGDLAANLVDITTEDASTENALGDGDVVVLLSAGAGFTITGVAVQFGRPGVDAASSAGLTETSAA